MILRGRGSCPREVGTPLPPQQWIDTSTWCWGLVTPFEDEAKINPTAHPLFPNILEFQSDNSYIPSLVDIIHTHLISEPSTLGGAPLGERLRIIPLLAVRNCYRALVFRPEGGVREPWKFPAI